MPDQEGATWSEHRPHRPVIMTQRGLVTAAHPLAALAGSDALRCGGHAVDAAIATNAVLAVVQPHMCGVGGDFFCLVYDAATGRVDFLNASGRTSRRMDRHVLTRRGLDEVPFRGGLSVTVPGCVDGWMQSWERHGRLPWPDLFDRAIEAARDGFAVSSHLTGWIAGQRDALADGGPLQETFLAEGGPPRPGSILRQPALADSLELIARQGGRAFYTGTLARRLCAGLRTVDGLLDAVDFEEHHSEWAPAISTTYRDTSVVTTGGNTQGLATLVALNVLAGYPVGDWDRHSFERIHYSVEALKLASTARDRVADPDFVRVPWTELLSDEYATDLRARIDPSHARQVASPATAGDTTAFAVADAAGNVVSGIQSLSSPFGAGVMPPGTGVVLHNRGAGFSLDGHHPNALEPRKRPLHTLMATMVLRGGMPVLAFGTMGGFGQPQTHVQVITNVIDDGLTIQEAIEAPRWVLGSLSGRRPSSVLQLEPRFPRTTIEAVQRAGHAVEVVQDWASQMGHAHGIVIDAETDVRSGGADPRGEGCAIGH
ncbi:MAG: gamma-glutamyltransferase [Nocardioidaceae bacterium]